MDRVLYADSEWLLRYYVVDFVDFGVFSLSGKIRPFVASTQRRRDLQGQLATTSRQQSNLSLVGR
jgi:hypothetical protein